MSTTEKKPTITKYPYTFAEVTLKNLGNATYYFLAAAKNPLGQEYNFKAIGGLHKQDTTAPSMGTPEHTPDWWVAKRVAGRDTYEDKEYNISFREAVQGSPDAIGEVNEYVYRGELILTFSEPIFELITSSDQNKTAVEITDDENDLEHYFGKRVSLSGGIKVYGVEIDGSTIKFKYKDATVGSRIVIFAKGFISDANSNVDSKNARLTLEFVVDYAPPAEDDDDDENNNNGPVFIEIVKPYFITTWSGTGGK